MSRSASAADDAPPISAAEADALFNGLSQFPVLILAVSGGPDSTALLVLAARWRANNGNRPTIIAATVDHGLRPESTREAKAVERLARKLGIPHRTLRWSGRKPKTALQEAARLARYRLLAKVARASGAGHVITAHTIDDQAETVLFRMARGSGVTGLAGMATVAELPVEEGRGIRLVRPLLGVAKARLIATLAAERIACADDPTNRDPRFARPRMRALLPVLAREGLTVERLARLAQRARRIEDALAHAANDARDRVTCMPWPEGGPVVMNAQGFAGLPQEVAMRLLGEAIAAAGDEGPVELAKLEALQAAIAAELANSAAKSGDARFRRTLAGAIVTVQNDRITVERAPPRRNYLTKRRIVRGRRAKRQ